MFALLECYQVKVCPQRDQKLSIRRQYYQSQPANQAVMRSVHYQSTGLHLVNAGKKRPFFFLRFTLDI